MDHIIHHKSMMDQSYILQPIYSKTFGMLNFINKRVRAAVVVAVIAKTNNKKVGIKPMQEAYLEPSQISTMEFCCQKD